MCLLTFKGSLPSVFYGFIERDSMNTLGRGKTPDCFKDSIPSLQESLCLLVCFFSTGRAVTFSESGILIFPILLWFWFKLLGPTQQCSSLTSGSLFRDYSWWDLGGPYMALGFEPRLAASKTSIYLATQSLWPFFTLLFPGPSELLLFL